VAPLGVLTSCPGVCICAYGIYLGVLTSCPVFLFLTGVVNEEYPIDSLQTLPRAFTTPVELDLYHEGVGRGILDMIPLNARPINQRQPEERMKIVKAVEAHGNNFIESTDGKTWLTRYCRAVEDVMIWRLPLLAFPLDILDRDESITEELNAVMTIGQVQQVRSNNRRPVWN
jgi:hypothetical protein